MRGGRKGRLLRNFSYGGVTPQFWNSVEAVAGPEELRVFGYPCGKGEPKQWGFLSHAAAPMLVRGVRTGWPDMTVPTTRDDVLTDLDALVSAAVAGGGVDDLEIAMLARAGEYTRFAGDVIHQPQDITETQFLVRAIVDGHAYRTATTVTAHLPASIELAASAARELAGRAGRSGSADVAGPQAEAATGTLWFEDTAAFDTGTRVRAARTAMDAAHAAGGEAAGMLGRAVTGRPSSPARAAACDDSVRGVGCGDDRRRRRHRALDRPVPVRRSAARVTANRGGDRPGGPLAPAHRPDARHLPGRPGRGSDR